MPYVTNGNIYAPVMMLAEKAADLIRGDTPLPPEPTPFYRHGVSPAPDLRRRPASPRGHDIVIRRTVPLVVPSSPDRGRLPVAAGVRSPGTMAAPRSPNAHPPTERNRPAMALARIPATSTRPASSDIAAFTAGIAGTVIRARGRGLRRGPPGPQRGLIDRRPAMIVQAANAGGRRPDRHVRPRDRPRARRPRRQPQPGRSQHVEGGIVLDLGAMKGLHIDPERRLAWAQPGLTAGEYTAAAAAHGLATPFGDTGSVGIAA